MRSETRNVWGSDASPAGVGGSDRAPRRGVEAGSHVASSSMHLYTDNSESASHDDTRSASRDAEGGQPAPGRRLHTPLHAIPTRGGRRGKGAYASAAGAAEASPPPRIPTAYGTAGGRGAGRSPAASAEDAYEANNPEGIASDEEEAYDEEGAYAEEYEEEEYAEEGEWESASDAAADGESEPSPETGMRAHAQMTFARTGATTAAAAAPRDARALRFDSEERTPAAHAPQPAALPHVAVALPTAFRREEFGAALRPPATAAKAAPVSNAFRRASPAVRLAYSVGYDARAGQSSTEPSSSSPVRQEAHNAVVGASRDSSVGAAAPPTAVTFTATNTFTSAASAEELRTSLGSSSMDRDRGRQTPKPGATPPSSVASVAVTSAEKHTVDTPQRPSPARSGFTSMAATPATNSSRATPAQSSGKRPTAVFHGGVGTPASTGAPTPAGTLVSTASSPLPPSRPTLEAFVTAPAVYQQQPQQPQPHGRVRSTGDQHARSGSDGDSSICFSAAVMSPVVALEDADAVGTLGGTELYRSGENVWVRRPSAGAADASLHVVPASAAAAGTDDIVTPTSMEHSSQVNHANGSTSSWPKRTLHAATGRSRTMADLLAEWKDTTNAVDIARSACEREAHDRTLSNTTGSPVFDSSPRVMSPLPMRESPMELADSTTESSTRALAGGPDARTGTDVDAGYVQQAVEHLQRQPQPQQDEYREPLLPPVALSVTVTNVFNYSESDRAWLTQGLVPAIAANASSSQSAGEKTSSAMPADAMRDAPLPSSKPAVTVALYSRPLLVHAPREGSHAGKTSMAGTRLFFRVLLFVLYVLPRTLISWLIRTTYELAVALAVLTLTVLAVDAAFFQWPVLWMHLADARGNATALASLLRNSIAAASWANAP